MESFDWRGAILGTASADAGSVATTALVDTTCRSKKGFAADFACTSFSEVRSLEKGRDTLAMLGP
jgi:hypothetical protein